ncbi:MAG: MBL fold metallo-hydrolase, partial [Desulfobacterales bacterium]
MGSKGLIAEHGLAFLIETGDRKILFDTGQNLALAHNAEVLGIDLHQIDTVVLSHGHYDHTGGLKSLVEAHTNFNLIAHPDVFDEKLRQVRGQYKAIGNPVARALLAKRGIPVRLADQPVSIAPGVRSSGEIPLRTDFEAVESGFFRRQSHDVLPDTLADD